MAEAAVTAAPAAGQNLPRVPSGTDLVEWYFEQGWTDGLPVVPPTASGSTNSLQRSAATRSS